MKPLDSAVNVARRIAEGQLENELSIHSKDEFGHLLGALKQMDTHLADIVRGIKTSSESIMVASSEIAAGNMDLSSRTEEQAASLEETAASMEELTATVKQNSENARQATTLAGNASDASSPGPNDRLRLMYQGSRAVTIVCQFLGMYAATDRRSWYREHQAYDK